MYESFVGSTFSDMLLPFPDMARRKGSITTLLSAPLLIAFILSVAADDSDILLNFKNSLSNSQALSNWSDPNSSKNPCVGDNPVWLGLKCSGGNVSFIILDNMGLSGHLDMDTLARLPSLRSFSIINNNFNGPMPDIKKLVSLKSVFLSKNQFSGEISGSAFEGLNSLKKVYLGGNQFTGEIPTSLVKLPRLVEVSLEDNQFQGRVPDFRQLELKMVNLSNNQLEGPIPKSLQDMNSTMFLGNKDLCGKPLEPCKSRKNILLILMAAVAAAVVASVAGAILYSRRSNRNSPPSIINPKNGCGTYIETSAVTNPSSTAVPPTNRGVDGKLCFVRSDRTERFELHDLLRASAEILGSGNFGSSYKAVLHSVPAVVVKRFRHMNSVRKDDFCQHMRRIGGLSHPNLLPLLAFYYRKEEKLLVSDFVLNGSLASHLHTNHGPDQPGLNWSTRLKIIKGVARGLAYLYNEFPNLTVPHGHLKSSNVLLDHDFEPLLSDYALVPVVNKEHAHQFMAAYRSPEFTRSGRTTRKTDVWSLGVLILELLTGKFPVNYLKQLKSGDADLATWVNSVVREEWTGEVFDKDMRGTKNGEGEMLKLLKIGMCCCEWNVDRRWDLTEALKRIEELKERNGDDDYSSYGSEDVYSSRGLTDDDFSFSIAG